MLSRLRLAPTADRLRARRLRVQIALRYEQYAFWRNRPIRPNVVMYESFSGNGVVCNPEAIFRALRADREFAHLRHVWVLRSRRENPAIVREFPPGSGVRFVRPNSFSYYRALATSGWLINNSTFPTVFGKRSGQVYLNTWHGTPLKKMGIDIGDRASRFANVIRNFLNADYLLSASPFMTERLYESAHRLDGIFGGQVIEEGYPRIDRQFREGERDRVRAQLNARGLALRDRRIVVYAPTWKGSNFGAPDDDAELLLARCRELQAALDPERDIVLLKTHQSVHAYAAERPQFRELLIPNEIPANAVLAATDVLVTDYSSIFFDFLPTGRPIFFLTPDIDQYAGYRGLYFEEESWPGPVVTTVADLAREIIAWQSAGSTSQISENYAAALARFAPHEDGDATRRVIDIVFRRRRHGSSVITTRRTERSRLLVYGGGMRPGEITSAVLGMLSQIDQTRFDVTVYFPLTFQPARLAAQAKIPAGIRQLSRVGGISTSKAQLRRWEKGVRSGRPAGAREMARDRIMWSDEWQRSFGSAQFDAVVDFSGSGAFTANLLLAGPDVPRSIWQHSDMAAEADRSTGGRQSQRANLRAVFGLYRQFDHVVSVSPRLASINASSLAEFDVADRIDVVPNAIDVDELRSASAAGTRSLLTAPGAGSVPAWVNDLDSHRGQVFVSAGQLSSARNVARAIRAFALVQLDRPLARLIIAGDGRLRNELAAEIRALGLEGTVWMTGEHNWTGHVARSDCLVLSSEDEGQPSVALAARAMGLAIVSVEFATVKDSVPLGAGVIVEPSDDALANGMRMFLDGQIAIQPFDADAYNSRAIATFGRIVLDKRSESP